MKWALPSEVAEDGEAQVELLHHAGEVPHLHDVPHAVLVFQEDEEAVDEVADEVLGGEA